MVRMAWNWQSTTTQQNWICVSAAVRVTVRQQIHASGDVELEFTTTSVWVGQQGANLLMFENDCVGHYFKFALKLLTYVACCHWKSWFRMKHTLGAIGRYIYSACW